MVGLGESKVVLKAIELTSLRVSVGSENEDEEMECMMIKA